MRCQPVGLGGLGLVRGNHLGDQVAPVQGVGLGCAHVAHRDHAVEHLAPSLGRREQLVGNAERVVVRRRLWQAGQERGLTPAEVGRVHSEVRLRRRLRAVRAIPIVDGVEVELEDLLLGVATLHLLGQHQLAELAADGLALRLLSVEYVVLHHLLRDRRAAERGRVMRQVEHDGDQQAPVIDPGVLIEGAVLGVDGRLLEVGADLAQRHHRAVLVVDGRDQVAVAVDDAGRLQQVGSLQLVDRGQITGEVVDHPQHPAGAEQSDHAQGDQRDQRALHQPRVRSAAGAAGARARPGVVLGRDSGSTAGAPAAGDRLVQKRPPGTLAVTRGATGAAEFT